MEAKYDEMRLRLEGMTDDELVEVAKKENAWSAMAIEILEARGYEVSETPEEATKKEKLDWIDRHLPALPERKKEAMRAVFVSQKPSVEAPRVVVEDVDMKFNTMVLFMVKWAFASIPALIIVFVIWGLVLSALFTLFLKGM